MNTQQQAKHTPGPWQAYNADGGHINKWWRVKAGNTPICVVKEQEHSETELANARLIAQAPALLEALQATIDFIDTYVAEIRDSKGNLLWLDFDATIEEARAAIQAATRS